MAKEPKNRKHYFKDLKAELKKVVWLTPKQLVKNTSAVITIVIITALIVLGLDLIFKFAVEEGLDKVKSTIVDKKGNTLTNDISNLVDLNTVNTVDNNIIENQTNSN